MTIMYYLRNIIFGTNFILYELVIPKIYTNYKYYSTLHLHSIWFKKTGCKQTGVYILGYVSDSTE